MQYVLFFIDKLQKLTYFYPSSMRWTVVRINTYTINTYLIISDCGKGLKMEPAFNDSNITMTTEINQIVEVGPFMLLLLILSPCCNLLLIAGIIWRKPICFIPWMVFYGLELFACWMSGFFLLFGKYIFLSIYWVAILSTLKVSSKIRNIFSS